MLKYLRYSDIAIRINLNPFNWLWKPDFSKDLPTAFYPKRYTYCVVWLFFQIFLDIDDGTSDLKAFEKMFLNHPAITGEIEIEESEVGHEVSGPRKTNFNVE